MRRESVSTYSRRPKVEAFSNAVDVVEHLHDPIDPRTECTALITHKYRGSIVASFDK